MKLQLTISVDWLEEPFHLHKSLVEVLAPVKSNPNQKARWDKVLMHANLIKKIVTAPKEVDLSKDETELLKQTLMNVDYNNVNVEIAFAFDQLFGEEQNE